MTKTEFLEAFCLEQKKAAPGKNTATILHEGEGFWRAIQEAGKKGP